MPIADLLLLTLSTIALTALVIALVRFARADGRGHRPTPHRLRRASVPQQRLAVRETGGQQPAGLQEDLVTDRALRICVVGDELVAGVGDPKALGWVGRVTTRTPLAPAPLVMTLAVPQETTTALSARWEAETALRFGPPAADGEHHLVIGLGSADLAVGMSLARSRLNLANILDVAESLRLAAFVVGPPPGDRGDPDQQAELSAAFADVAQRRRVPYVETYGPLARHEQWLADLASGDGHTPGQAGYGLMAWLVLHTGWQRWLGLPDDAV